MRVRLSRAVGVYVSWLAFLGAILLIGMGDVLPMRLAFLPPERTFTVFIEAELFFILIVWPFFFLGKGAAEPSLGWGGTLLLLLGVALPFALLCRELAGVNAWAFCKGHFLVAASGAFSAAFLGSDPKSAQRRAPGYLLGVFVLGAALPFSHYLCLEYRGVSLQFLSSGSPFWVAVDLEGNSAIVSAALLGGGAVAVGLGRKEWLFSRSSH